MKNKIRKFVLDQGIDDVGFAAVSDYNSPQSPKIETIFPEAKSIVVACVKEMSHVESPNPQIAMNGRLDIQEYARSTNYKISRFLEKECGAKAMSVPSFLSPGSEPAKFQKCRRCFPEACRSGSRPGRFRTPQSGDSSAPGAARSLHGGADRSRDSLQIRRSRRNSAPIATSAWRAVPLPLWMLKDRRISGNVSRFLSPTAWQRLSGSG